MLLLLALGQHGALEAVQRSLRGDERLLAFLDDIYIITTQPRVGVLVARAMPLNRLPVLRTLEPWCGRDLTCLSRNRALRCWEHHWATLSLSQLEQITEEHRVLLERIPAFQDVQSAWLILLHCASARANYLLRVVRPELVRHFAESHDGLWRCLCQILDIPEGQCEPTVRIASTMPLVLGGIGLRSAVRTSLPAYWASWRDCLHMVHQRHPDISELLVNHLEAGGETPYLSAAVATARELQGIEGFVPPSWSALALGARPPATSTRRFRLGRTQGEGGGAT